MSLGAREAKRLVSTSGKGLISKKTKKNKKQKDKRDKKDEKKKTKKP